MPRVATRVKAKVNAIAGAELHCNACMDWKDANSFTARSRVRNGKIINDEYNTKCDYCIRLATMLRKGKKDNKLPGNAEIREALGAPAPTMLSLNQANHAKRVSVPLSQDELDFLRERREKREKENTKPDLCYLVGTRGESPYLKIGHSRDPWARVGDYQAGSPKELVVMAVLPGGKAKERELHSKFMHYHTSELVGEWFIRAPAILNEFSGGRI